MKIYWTYALGWDISALWLLSLVDVDGDSILLCDARHTSLFSACLNALEINLILRPYPAGMTRGKRYSESFTLIQAFATEQGLDLDGEFVNLEHDLTSQTQQIADAIEGDLYLPLHRAEAYFSPSRNLIQQIKIKLYEELGSFSNPPLIGCGAHGKLTTLKVESSEGRQELAAKESVPLSVICETLHEAAGSYYDPYFISVDYRSPEIIHEEIRVVKTQFSDLGLLRADIDHNQAGIKSLIRIPAYYAALDEIAQENGGKFAIITNRSNATHYGAILVPVVPILILGPTGTLEWSAQANRLNTDGRRQQSKRVVNISGNNWEQVLLSACAELRSIVVEK